MVQLQPRPRLPPPGSASWPLAASAAPPGPTRCRRPRWSAAPRWPRWTRRRRRRSSGSGGCPRAPRPRPQRGQEKDGKNPWESGGNHDHLMNDNTNYGIMVLGKKRIISFPIYTPCIMYIYLQNRVIYGVNVSKYASTMEHLGLGFSCST